MSLNNQQQDTNPYTQDYALPIYVQNELNNQSQNNNTVFQANKLNHGTLTQPLIYNNDSIDYTESFSEMAPRTNDNQNNGCQLSDGMKCFLIIEVIADIVGVILYFIIF